MSAAAELRDPYAYWRDALTGAFGPVHDSDPQPGFYRKRTVRGGPFVPVAIWDELGQMVALVDGKQADAEAIWSYVCQHPVTEEAYRERVATGKWHDEDGGIADSLTPPSAGHNEPPQDDADVLATQIEAASANAKAYETIADDATAAKAQSARARLNELSGIADKRRDALKRPHLEAGKAIDARWQPLVKAAKAAADAIARALSAHETRKARAAEEARRATERAAQEAQQKAVGVPQPVVVPAAPEPVATIRGAYGRAAAVKVVRVAKVEDYAIAVTYFLGNTEFRAMIDKLAQKAVDAGIAVPGVIVTEERKVI